MEERFNEVKEGINAVLLAVEALGKNQQELRKDVNELKSGQEELVESIKALTLVAEEAEKDRRIIKKDVKDTKEMVSRMKVSFQSHNSQILDLSIRVQDLECSFSPEKE